MVADQSSLVGHCILLHSRHPWLVLTLLLADAGDESASEAAAAESAVKRAKQGSGKTAPEDIVNALAAAEEQHKRQQAVGGPALSAFWVYGQGFGFGSGYTTASLVMRAHSCYAGLVCPLLANMDCVMLTITCRFVQCWVIIVGLSNPTP